ncbi:MAG: biotin synthase [Epsilonproteobacteria bacterium]|nr:biotin synthase [Campylobacterota bacterium]
MVYLCAISNISSGNCSEDCKFCTQSAHYRTSIPTYKQKDISQILQEAIIAKNNKASGFCLVSAGNLTDKKVEYIAKIAHTIKNHLHINLIACNGLASVDQLKELKKAGINSYNHNLETSREFYPNICSTHQWDDRYQTCLNVKQAGLNLCSGVLFGLGESTEDRYSVLQSLKTLLPVTTPINFYIPNPNLPIKQNYITKPQAVFWIKTFKSTLNNIIMLAGGREQLFGELIDGLEAGAEAIVIGDYLTTKGQKTHKDLQLLQKFNYQIKDCNA